MTFIVFVKMSFLELVVDLFSISIDFFSGNDETSKTMQKDEEAVALLRGEDAKNALITDEVETFLKDIFTCEGNLATFCVAVYKPEVWASQTDRMLLGF